MGTQTIRVFACLCWGLGLAGALAREGRSDTDLPSDRCFVEDPCRYFQVAALQYPPPREITKQDYVNWLRTYFERFSAGVHRNVYKNPGMPVAEFVLACAALYDATGEEPYCQDTLQGFRAFHAGLPHITKPIYVNGAHFACFLWAWDVLRQHQRVTPEDEAMFREILRVGIPQSQYASSPSERERDPGNRGLSRAAVLGGTAHLIPDLPQAADWKDYAEKVWNDQWPFRDTCENTSGYNGYWLTILLVYFLPRPGCALQIGDESTETLWRNAPQPIQYQWRGLGQPEQPLRFDSLLYPHHPSPDPEAVVKQVQVVLEEGDTVVFRAEFSRWRKGVFPNLEATPETIWVALNPSGKAIQAGELETDAQRVYLRVENGQPQHLCARAATHVRLGGKALYVSQEPGDVDEAIAGKQP